MSTKVTIMTYQVANKWSRSFVDHFEYSSHLNVQNIRTLCRHIIIVDQSTFKLYDEYSAHLIVQDIQPMFFKLLYN
jgi:hypothetical protein